MTLGEYISNLILLLPTFLSIQRRATRLISFPLDFFSATIHFILSEPSSLAFCLASSKRCIEMSFSNNNTRIGPHLISLSNRVQASNYYRMINLQLSHPNKMMAPSLHFQSRLNVTEITSAPL